MSIRIEDLAKTDFRSVTVAGGKRIAPTSPGEMLAEEFGLVGGLALSQLLTLYTTPVVYLYLDRLRTWLRGMRRDRAPERKQVRAAAE